MAKNKYDELITKSLDEIDTLVDGLNTDKLSKARDEEDLAPEDVSDNAPLPDDGTEAPAPEEEEEAATDEDGNPIEDDEDDEDNYEKSLENELNSNESVKKALEVSEFLQELVKGLDTMVTDRTDRISKSIIESSDESNGLLVKSIVGIAKGQKAVLETNAELLKSVRMLNSRMKNLETQPSVRKSVSNTAQVMEKSFQASAGEKATGNIQLNKSQASAKLMAEYEGGNKELLNDILAFDGTGDTNALSDQAKHVLGLL